MADGRTEVVVNESAFYMLLSHTVSDVQTLGKELFMFFANLHICLRVHFLMSGTFRINGQKLDPEGKMVSGDPTLLLELSKDTLAFFQSSCEIRSASACLEKIDSLHTLDICHRLFSQRRAVELIQTQTGRMICDVLLDQSILPGVGNIIKNENSTSCHNILAFDAKTANYQFLDKALFDSGIKPDTQVEYLSKNQISRLVRMTRDFSLLFYKCRRDGKPLEQHLKVYRKLKCRECGNKIVNTRMGESSDRLTSFCAKCQDNKMEHSSNRIMSRKNSLLGWVFTEERSPKEFNTVSPTKTWACCKCTFLNSSMTVKCEMCFMPKAGLTELSSKTECFIARNKNDSDKREKDVQFTDNMHCAGHPLKRLLDCKDRTENKRQKISVIGDLNKEKASCIPIDVTQKSPVSEDSGQPALNKVKPPECAEHKRSCVIREVHKKGDNLHRMFWSCPHRKGCKFFKWADEAFPLCDGHGQRTVLRTVLKQGANNGRKFFACRLPKNKQCGFFQWADQY